MGRRATAERVTPFGKWLTERRLSAGFTMQMLAERIDTAPGAIAMYETGRRNPKRSMVSRLARGLVRTDLVNEDADEEYKRLADSGLRAAGFSTDGAVVTDPIATIVRESGYTDPSLTAAELQDLREDITVFVETWMRRRARGRS